MRTNNFIREYYALWVVLDETDPHEETFVGYFDTQHEAEEKAKEMGVALYGLEYQSDHEGDGMYTVIG